ncbi:MAG TPA: lycopene cyclase domain-containing protein [Patescibacteria group bacterium]|jgi:lycopene cyclase domain-containing protein|nr:lycopene cyclase domain-containing protein [Patescibacteria group bacterium]
MTSWSYLIALIGGLLAMGVIDWRQHLALFYDRNRTVLTLMVGVGLFILWDALGIRLGIFFSGHSAYMSGIYLAAEFPIEELFFLLFLCYFSLILYRLLEDAWPRT